MSKFLIQRKLHTNFLTKNRRSSSWRLLDSMHRTKYTSNTPCQKLESISTSDASCSSRDVFPNDFECFFTMLRISCLRNMNHACNRSINFIFLTGTINHTACIEYRITECDNLINHLMIGGHTKPISVQFQQNYLKIVHQHAR